MMWLLWGWIGCQPQQASVLSWTSQSALQPTFERLDVDQSAGIEAAEWTRVSYGGPSFSDVDSNGSGALDLEELLSLVHQIDPDGFDRNVSFNGPGTTTVAAAAPVSREIRQVGNALLFLIEEVRETPGILLPVKEEVRDASWTESLHSAESQALLQKLRVAWDVAGREFPSGQNWEEPASGGPPGSSP
jgi:hypothetical protein